MKKFVNLFLVVLSTSHAGYTYAPDESRTISEVSEMILAAIEREFSFKRLSSNTRKEISKQFSFALRGDWYASWRTSTDLKANKSQDDKVRIFVLIVVNETSIYNISFTYFPSSEQIYYIRKQYVEGSSEVLNLLKEHKIKNGYVDLDSFHIEVPGGMAAYIDGGIIGGK